MRPEQQYFLQRKSIPIYAYTVEDLVMLQEIVEEELDLRQDVRNKELKVELAKKVEAESGNDQHIQELKDQLFLARQTYAKRVSQFDDYRYIPGYVQTDANGQVIGASEDHLVPNYLQPLIQSDETPRWQVSTVNEDGTETVLGIQ